jgi:hypothetical protein
MSTPHPGWLVAGSILFVSSAGWGAFNTVDLLAHEVSTVTEVIPAEGLTALEVDNADGRVTVTGTDTDEITIVARVSEGLRDTGNTYTVSGDRLHVRGTCPNFGGTWCSVDYRIELPAGMAVDIATDNGSIDAVDVLGPLTLDSDNGSIEVRGAAGALRTTSDNGSIDATGIRSADVYARSDNGSIDLVLADPPRSVDVQTDNGSVEVVVPEKTEGYAVTVETDNGDAVNEVRSDPASARTIVARSDNGDVTVRHPD